MTSAKVINAQHLENAGVVVLIIEGKPNLFEEAKIMAS
jgi:hypothetical protein